MTKMLDGKTALVTGAAQGIGAACAIALSQAGAHVVCADIRDAEKTARTAHEDQALASAAYVDVSKEASVEHLFSEIDTTRDGLDILVHCAGIIDERPLLSTTAEQFDRVIAVNLRGSFLIGREAIRRMQGRDDARVILIASDLAYLGRETYSAYVASKHGVLGLVRSWTKEFAPNILVNAICPGPIDTPMLDVGNISAEWREKELAIPLARFGEATEVAHMALFLAGPGGAYITGQGIGVNGGSVMP